MTLLETYCERRAEGKITSPSGVSPDLNNFMRFAHSALKKDLDKEGVSSCENLTSAKNFLAFCKEHESDFKGFGFFIYDHQGVYDSYRCFYNWQTLYPVVSAIFMFGVKMPHKSRLIELTRRYDLAYWALDDPDVCKLVMREFKTYADIKDKFLDEHGRAQTVLERLYARLHYLSKHSCLVKGSPQWCLMHLIYDYLYAEIA